MRKATMLVSLASILFLGVGVVIEGFSIPVELPGMAWSLSPDLILSIGILLTGASFTLWIIYCWFQQERAAKQQFKKLGIATRSELLRSKRIEAAPYKHEVWLQLIVVVSLPLSNMIAHVIGLVFFNSYSYGQTPLQWTIQNVCELLIPISIFIYTILGTDFTKKSKANTKD